MPSDNEKKCLMLSGGCIIVTVVIVVCITQFAKSNPNTEWELVGGRLWQNNSGSPEGNVAISDAGDRVLLVEFNQPFVGLFDLQQLEEETSDEEGFVESPSSIPAPTVDQTGTFRQLGSLSGDGTTIAIGYPEALLLDSDNEQATGYVSVYSFDENTQEWTLKGNQPSFENVKDPSRDYASGFFGSATALSKDGNRLAIGITHVQSVVQPNSTTATSVVYNSYVQVLELRGGRWEVLGPWIEGKCDADSLGCMPCDGTFGPGEIDFGMALAMTPDGTRLAVGTPQAVECKEDQAPTGGFVRVYDFNVDRWQQVGSDIVELEFNDAEHYFSPRELGLSLSLSASGQRLAVGSNTGAVVLDFDGTGEWKFNEDFKWSNKNTFENFNTQVSLTADGNNLAFSGPESTANGGKVETLEWSGGKWNQYGKTIAGNTGFGSSIGMSSSDGKFLAVKGGFDTTIYQEP